MKAALTALSALFAGCTANAAPLSTAASAASPSTAASSSSAAAASSSSAAKDSSLARPAHDLPSTAKPDRDLAAITVLRAKGQAGLAEILRAYDAAPAARKAALAATADAVAAQRYATASRLYWYTDLAAAQAEAKRRQKPILALRMLGRLDEDLSCANSRFFRTALYPDARVAKLLRDEFVLLWTSERDVPRVTIDYGDGRRLRDAGTRFGVDAGAAAQRARDGRLRHARALGDVERCRAQGFHVQSVSPLTPSLASTRGLVNRRGRPMPAARSSRANVRPYSRR